jgi:hypothetical protein
VPILVVMVALEAASILCIYRFKGKPRDESRTEYLHESWTIFSAPNFALYMTTLPRRSSCQDTCCASSSLQRTFFARAEFAVRSIKRPQRQNGTAAAAEASHLWDRRSFSA